MSLGACQRAAVSTTKPLPEKKQKRVGVSKIIQEDD